VLEATSSPPGIASAIPGSSPVVLDTVSTPAATGVAPDATPSLALDVAVCASGTGDAGSSVDLSSGTPTR
jgi:hypothetical protein